MGGLSAVWGERDSQGKGSIPRGKPYRQTLLSGLYAARARADVCSVHRRRRQLLRRRVKFLRRLRVPTIGLSNIGAYQFSEC